jgi:hypothetical protein
MIEIPPDGTIPSVRLAELLAPTLGWEKSSEVVDASVGRLRLAPNALTPEQAFAVLDDLARTPGMVGIAARFARSRLDAPRVQPPPSDVLPTSGHASAPASMARPPDSGKRPPDTPRCAGHGEAPAARSTPKPVAPGTTISTSEVAALLSSAMGTKKAQEIVLATARHLGFTAERLDKAQAMALLDHLAVEPGVVGLCARFGKARLILRFAA